MNTIKVNRIDLTRGADPPLTPPKEGNRTSRLLRSSVVVPLLGGFRSGFGFLLLLRTCSLELPAATADGALTPNQALASFKLEPGMRMGLAAAEPLVGDSVAIA